VLTHDTSIIAGDPTASPRLPKSHRQLSCRAVSAVGWQREGIELGALDECPGVSLADAVPVPGQPAARAQVVDPLPIAAEISGRLVDAHVALEFGFSLLGEELSDALGDRLDKCCGERERELAQSTPIQARTSAPLAFAANRIATA